MSLTIIIIDKAGELKTLNVKNYCEQELYKKCGFKKDTNFILQTTWNIRLNDTNYNVSMYGKTDGKKNFENISKFPHPVNDKTFYGSCALVASSGETNINLSIDLWRQLHNLIMENEYSYSFVSSTQALSKQLKKEKQRKKEVKEKEKEECNSFASLASRTNAVENNSNAHNVLAQELEEEAYYYSSDDEMHK